MRNAKRNRFAFTLIEVIGCLAVIAILASLLIPTIFEAINNARQHIMTQGGSLPDRAPLARARQQREQSASALQETLQQIGSSGVLVKDLDIGLIDFPCLMNDREVYLCWKLGEGHIEFWHHIEDGFAGRKPVDQEFLRNIRREKPN